MSAALKLKSLTISRSISWTGYRSMKDRNLLIDAICETYDRSVIRQEDGKDTKGMFYPDNGKTYCNMALNDVAIKIGCNELTGLMANDICDLVSASPNWKKVEMKDCQSMANIGTLVIATQRGTPHGHVCIIRPGVEKFSGRYGKVPSVMNVGKDVAISKGVNWAFRDIPEFYAWIPSI